MAMLIMTRMDVTRICITGIDIDKTSYSHHFYPLHFNLELNYIKKFSDILKPEV